MAKKHPFKMTWQKRQNLRGYGFMAPWIIGFIVFTFVPFLYTIYLSFMQVDKEVVGYVKSYIGWHNYYVAFFLNENFTPTLIGFIRMVIPYTFVIIVVAFILAYLLNKVTKGRTILRTIYFLPVIIMSGPVMSRILEDADAAVKASLGFEEETNVFIIIMISQYSPVIAAFLESIFNQLTMILWFTGIPVVLFISGLQKINPSLYEAASIDRANQWQILWKITIPMMKPTALVATVFTIVQLGVFDSSDIFNLIKTQTKNDNGLGLAATYAWIYSVVCMIIIGVAFLLFKERDGRKRR